MLWQSKEWIVFVSLVILSYSDSVVWAILFYGWLYCSVSLSFLCGNLSDLQLPIIYIYTHIYNLFISFNMFLLRVLGSSVQLRSTWSSHMLLG